MNASFIEKVTLFITRETPSGIELLMFQHPNAGIQLPAGTVEIDEIPEQAAFREAFEETGLDQWEWVQALGVEIVPILDGQLALLKAFTLHNPEGMPHFAQLQRGAKVQRLSVHDNLARVRYENERMQDGQIIYEHIVGELPAALLVESQRRTFFHLRTAQQTPERWDHPADMGWTFTCFWTPLANHAVLHSTQAGWLERWKRNLNLNAIQKAK